MKPTRRRGLKQLFSAALVLHLGGLAAPSLAQDKPPLSTQSKALSQAAAAVVGVQALALEGARSNRTLGRVRDGSGVVIDAKDGLVLTIGYLVLEADQVKIVTDDQRIVPARVIGYDVATGFGLVRALAPLGIAAAPLAGIAPTPDEPLMVVSGGTDGQVSIARLVSRRPFSGYWEYHLDEALFTAPARRDHSGAGLFDAQGQLLGIGSLFVPDAMGENRPRMPGNMFVPVGLLRPILDELRSRGTTRHSERAWIGVNCTLHEGSLRVARVNEDSPADVAGIEVGDRILRVDGQAVETLDALWKALWRGGPPERAILLDIDRGGEPHTLRVHSVDRAKTLKRAEGV